MIVDDEVWHIECDRESQAREYQPRPPSVPTPGVPTPGVPLARSTASSILPHYLRTTLWPALKGPDPVCCSFVFCADCVEHAGIGRTRWRHVVRVRSEQAPLLVLGQLPAGHPPQLVGEKRQHLREALVGNRAIGAGVEVVFQASVDHGIGQRERALGRLVHQAGHFALYGVGMRRGEALRARVDPVQPPLGGLLACGQLLEEFQGLPHLSRHLGDLARQRQQCCQMLL